jgi:hypothetical protein
MAEETTEQIESAGGEASAAVAVYQKRIPTVEAIKFDGKNGDEVIKFTGKDYAKKIGEDALELRVHGAHPQSPKEAVSIGQWVVKQATGSPVAVINDGDFTAQYEKTDKEPTPPPPEVEEKAAEQEQPEGEAQQVQV